jgi:hypothetical protein
MGHNDAGVVAEQADGVNQRRRQLGERPVELSEGLHDTADCEGGIDAIKPSLECISVGEIVFTAAFL